MMQSRVFFFERVEHFAHVFFLLLHLRPLISTLFPYTTLFRSLDFAPLVWQVSAPVAANGFRFSRQMRVRPLQDRKSTRLNSSHVEISYAVFCLKKKK